MHTWHSIDFQGNFPENRSISEKANYSTESSGNFRTKSPGETYLKIWVSITGLSPSFLKNSGKCCSICHWKFSKQGRLPCDEKFWYELSKSPALMDETCFQEFSGKEDNLPRCSKIFENFFIYGWMFLFSEIQQFPDFLKTCTGNFHTICPLFEIFGIFIWKESAPEFLIK